MRSVEFHSSYVKDLTQDYNDRTEMMQHTLRVFTAIARQNFFPPAEKNCRCPPDSSSYFYFAHLYNIFRTIGLLFSFVKLGLFMAALWNRACFCHVVSSSSFFLFLA